MTPQEHYKSAEKLIEQASRISVFLSEAGAVNAEQITVWQTSISQYLAMAQVHATLATAPAPEEPTETEA